MAGAGKKTFVAGEVLTAAQVNDYLMDQAVMRFSGSAARAASITAPTEGMVTYLDDSNVLEYYDGSAWVNVVPQSEIDGKIAASLITASGQVLVGAGSASLIAIAASLDGQVLTAASAQPGGYTFTTPATGADATFFSLAATGVTELPNTLGAGFYKVAAGSLTFTTEQFGFMDSDGVKYGFAVSSGVGLGTIPVEAASVFATTGTLPVNLLVEEVSGVTDTLLQPLTITNIEWDSLSGFSFDNDAASIVASIGYYQSTGSFVNLGPTSASTLSYLSASLDNNFLSTFDVGIVGIDQYNRVGLATPVTTPEYPFVIYDANGTYTPPPWSASVDVLVVSGGGGSGGVAARSAPTQIRSAGGGGAGGASVWTNLATPASVAITIGAGGAGGNTTAPNTGASGNTSFFDSASVAGGGGGGGSNPSATEVGAPGASGGGGGAYYRTSPGTVNAASGGGTGTAGIGNDGGAGAADWATFTLAGGGGGGFNSAASGNTEGDAGTQWGYAFSKGGRGATGSPAGAITPGGGNGGPGVASTTAGAVTGQAGASGIVIIKALA